MEYFAKNILNHVSTNKLVKLLGDNDILNNQILSILYERIIHFDGSTTDNELKQILTHHNFTKIDLRFNKNITSDILQLLVDKNAIILTGNKQLSVESLKKLVDNLTHCELLNLDGTHTTNEVIEHIGACKYISVAQTNINNDCLKYLNNAHDIDLWNTPVTKMDKLSKCHFIELGYTGLSTTHIGAIKPNDYCKISYDE